MGTIFFSGQWQSVSSSWLAAFQYDEGTRILRIRFNDGAVCRYNGISPEQAESLHFARSKGKWVWHNIIDHPYTVE